MKKLQIRYQQPPPGKRKEICRGDEALVRRITSGTHEGLVERVQELGPLKATGQDASFELFTNRAHGFPSSLMSYHLLKFLSLGLAHRFSAEHVVNVKELRFYRKHGKKYAAIYSEYVPDETGVIARRCSAMKRFYSAPDKSTGLAIRENEERFESGLLHSDRINRQGIITLLNFGFGFNHMTANYHVSDGKMVVFEIDSLDMRTTFGNVALWLPKDDESFYNEAAGYLAAIYTIVLKTWVYANPNYYSMEHYPFHEMFRDVYAIFTMRTPSPVDFLNDGSKSFAYPQHYFSQSSMFREQLKHEPDLPCVFDQVFIDYLNGYQGPVRKFNQMR